MSKPTPPGETTLVRFDPIVEQSVLAELYRQSHVALALRVDRRFGHSTFTLFVRGYDLVPRAP
jgi:hypothetical protein